MGRLVSIAWIIHHRTFDLPMPTLDLLAYSGEMLRRNCFAVPFSMPSRHQRRERPMLIGVAKQAQDTFVIESRPKFDFPRIISNTPP